jgi:aspartyl/asparaginyl beta-hydroxylase (cupin superfamily)
MDKATKKVIRKSLLGGGVLALGLYAAPAVVIVWLTTGFIDVFRHRTVGGAMLMQYFMGNGMLTWFLSPLNLFFDLLGSRNRKIFKLDDIPPAHRAELEDVLRTFDANKEQIFADIGRSMAETGRSMMVYQWYGKNGSDAIPAFNRKFRFLKTICVSTFAPNESTRRHFGPLRLTFRVLYNLQPPKTDAAYIECDGQVHYWKDDPLYIFDDTMMHRSVNGLEERRYCVFMDILRPSPMPALLAGLLVAVAACARPINKVFYRNWAMIGQKR